MLQIHCTLKKKTEKYRKLEKCVNRFKKNSEIQGFGESAGLSGLARPGWPRLKETKENLRKT